MIAEEKKANDIMVPEGGLEPPHPQGTSDFESQITKNPTPRL